MRYAADTSVSCERSKGEIETTLKRYGADQFMSGWKESQAAIQFRLKNKMVRFILPLPDSNSDEFTKRGCVRPDWHDKARDSVTHSPRCFSQHSPEIAMRSWEQACRQRWRALALAIKAKLEAVECGITTFEEEFLAHIVVPGQKGMTMGDIWIKRLEDAYETGKTPVLSWDGK